MELNAARGLGTLSILGSLILLAACGGGDASSGADNGDPPPTPTFFVGGTVAGLADKVVLSNGVEEVSVDTNGAFRFDTKIRSGDVYAITVKAHPSFPAQDCTVAAGSGTIGATDVTNVAVTCTDLAAPIARVEAGVGSATLTWTQPEKAESFKVHIATQPDCDIDIQSDAFCIDATLLSATSPVTLTDLRNGQAYFFQIETVYENDARGLAAEVGARPNTLAFDGPVNAIAPAAQGAPPADGSVVYLGGDFTQVGITTGSGVPLDTATGQLASADFPMVDGTVLAVVADDADGWYIGGQFTFVGGTPKSNVAHLLADGSVDQHWDASINGIVYALGVSGGAVYVGGDFDVAGAGVGRNGLAAFDAQTGALRDDWDPDANGTVFVLVARDDIIYAGGVFTEVDHVPQARLAAIGAGDGSVLAQWAPQLVDGTVSAIGVSDDGRTVYVGGSFTQIGGDAGRQYLAAFLAPHAGGVGQPTTWNPRVSADVTALAVSRNIVYVGGSFQHFTSADGADTPRDFLAALNATTAAVIEHWAPRPSGLPIDALAVSRDGSTVYVGGPFTRIDTQDRRHLAAIDASGVVKDWNPNPNRLVRTLAVASDTVFAGGHFTSVGNSVPRNHLAALDASGALTAWNPDAKSRVTSLAVAADGTVYAGGFFDRVGDGFGIARNRLAAFDASGAVTQWDPDLDDWVNGLVISGSTVYVAGRFLHVGGVSSGGLAAIDSETADLIAGWQDPRIVGGAHALVVHRGTVYAAGGSVAAEGGDRFHLFGFKAQNGQLNLDWNPGLDDFAGELAVAGDTIYVGGRFGTVNVANGDDADPVRRNRLAAFPALDGDGAGSAKVLPWNPNVLGAQIRALAIHGPTIYVAGELDGVNSHAGLLPRRNLAAFETAGEDQQGKGNATPWNPRAAFHDVNALSVSGSNVFVGGDFKSLNGNASGGFGVVDSATGQIAP